MLLYIHVPFCRRKCPYCAFYSVPFAGREEALALWRSALGAEMRHYAGALPGRRVESIFLGGGTPSLIPPAMLGGILDDCARLFALEDGIEVSMEANPDSVTGENARGYLLAGVNRVSLGVQALDDALLRVLGRVHDKKQALEAFCALRNAGFGNVGMDLMWGVPGEDCASWQRQVREAASMRPEHLSCYGLTLEEGTPLAESRPALPCEDDLAQMYMDCGAILDQSGYAQYEVSNYALPGRACRHNRGYWLGRDYLGLGPSAVSCMNGTRRTNSADIMAWSRSAGQGGAAEMEALSPRERNEEFVMLRLRMAEGFAFSEYAERTGRDLRHTEAEFLGQLEREGLADCGGGRLRLTRRGMLLSNSIISRLFDGAEEQA